MAPAYPTANRIPIYLDSSGRFSIQPYLPINPNRASNSSTGINPGGINVKLFG